MRLLKLAALALFALGLASPLVFTPAAGIVEAGGEATRNKVRTAPLWGLRTRDRLMHDGGSSSPPSNSGAQSFAINEAVLRHAGEAAAVKNAYVALTEMQKRQLVKSLKSL